MRSEVYRLIVDVVEISESTSLTDSEAVWLTIFFPHSSYVKVMLDSYFRSHGPVENLVEIFIKFEPGEGPHLRDLLPR